MLAAKHSEPASNIQSLIGAQVFAEYGQNVVIRRFGTTALGQNYCIFTRKRMLGGYQTHMITANPRNRPFISLPFKVSGPQVLEEARDFVNQLANLLSKPAMFSLGNQPPGVYIPVGREMMQLDLLPEGVHDFQDPYLEIGDEIYVECIVSGITFYHSGIYAGNGRIYHYMSNSQEVNSSLVALVSTFAKTPASVMLDYWQDFVYALAEMGDQPPRVFRVTHPLLCRSADTIIETCEKLQTEWDYYDIRSRNCQHFSSLCSTGAMFSYDMGNNLKYLACTLLRPSALLAPQKYNWDSQKLNL